MDDDVENLNLKMNTNQLLAFQRDLKQEKELLLKILTKIDNQVHRLQVEQLHLLGLMNKTLKSTEERLSPYEPTNDDQEESVNKSLDLSIDCAFKYYQEEVEVEDED
ncbi:uncharacterized protein LOC143178198 [Calliopsis andreniformis]|uniref:uncharacterized protein LOC143178198 n=1 Tax=Calliopsis andreniformis TaxID=337506 RepID=UPI003FCD9ED8